MACIQYSASAPGSFMISGEHAVLRGKLALVAAIDKRITVTLTPRDDNFVHLISPVLGEYKTPLSKIVIEPPFQFVLASIKYYLPILPNGFELKIQADFSSTLGLSSSAAVTVATVAVLAKFTQQELTQREYLLKAKKIITAVQQMGSGADLAAAVYGGVLAYVGDPFYIEELSVRPVFNLIYTGYKTPTVEVVGQINQQEATYPSFYKGVFNAIDTASREIKKALIAEDWQKAGEWMNRHYGLQQAMQLACPKMKVLIARLNLVDSVFGAKISGSGLGDCLLALGNLPSNTLAEQIPVTIADQGLIINE